MKELIEKYYADNYRKLVKAYTRRCGTVDIAEEVIQEAFTLALEYADSYNAAYASFPTWFSRITNNAFLKAMKTERMSGVSDELDEELLEPQVHDLFTEQLATVLEEEMKKKPKHIAEVLYLYYVKGYPIRNVVAVTDVKSRNVEAIVRRFREEMVAKYGEKDSVR